VVIAPLVTPELPVSRVPPTMPDVRLRSRVRELSSGAFDACTGGAGGGMSGVDVHKVMLLRRY
jgi:hypothetical protein